MNRAIPGPTEGAMARTIGGWGVPRSGCLFAFCGVDGSGKTTMIERAQEYLEECGHTVFVTAIPTRDARSHQMFVDAVRNPDPSVRDAVDFWSLALVLMGDRLNHVRTEIVPRLEDGQIVLCHRYVHTALAHLHAHGSPPSDIDIAYRLAAYFPQPDATFLLGISSEAAIARVRVRTTEQGRFFDEDLLTRLNGALHQLAAVNDVELVDATASVDDSFEQIRHSISQALASKQSATSGVALSTA